jgi:hypothetical protein
MSSEPDAVASTQTAGVPRWLDALPTYIWLAAAAFAVGALIALS